MSDFITYNNAMENNTIKTPNKIVKEWMIERMN